MKPRKTTYEKILPLVQHSPNNATIKTALRHFGDDALLPVAMGYPAIRHQPKGVRHAANAPR